MTAQQAQWPTQQTAGWDAQPEDPYAASYYEAYPATPGLEVYPAPAAVVPEAYPAVLEAPVTDEFQKKRADDLESNSWSLYLLRVCTILMVIIVSGLIAFVMVGGNKWLQSNHMTTTDAVTDSTDSTAKSTRSSSRKAMTRHTHRGSERTKPSVPSEVVTVIGRYNLAAHVSQYRRARKKVAVRDDELGSVPTKRKLHGRAGTARRKRTETTLE